MFRKRRAYPSVDSRTTDGTRSCGGGSRASIIDSRRAAWRSHLFILYLSVRLRFGKYEIKPNGSKWDCIILVRWMCIDDIFLVSCFCLKSTVSLEHPETQCTVASCRRRDLPVLPRLLVAWPLLTQHRQIPVDYSADFKISQVLLYIVFKGNSFASIGRRPVQELWWRQRDTLLGICNPPASKSFNNLKIPAAQ